MEVYSNEIFMNIPGTSGKYQASNMGRIKGPRKILKNKPNRQGYNMVTVLYGKKPMEKRVNRLVAEAFFKHYSETLQVNHIDGDKMNNRLNNLEMVTALENMRHAIKNGLINNNGENCKTSVLKNDDVLAIRSEFKDGCTKSHLSRKFGVSRKTIREIVNRERWSHI